MDESQTNYGLIAGLGSILIILIFVLDLILSGLCKPPLLGATVIVYIYSIRSLKSKNPNENKVMAVIGLILTFLLIILL